MAMNFDALNHVYNHYLTEYAPKTNSPFDAHKKSDLRNIYNSIVKMNKESPVYLLNFSTASKSYAVELKENARAFHNAVASTSSSVGNKDVLDQKIAYSSRPEIASVKYIGEGHEDETRPLALSVTSLANPQTNIGKALRSDAAVDLKPGTYSFDLTINDLSYEFQFQLRHEDTNKEVQQRLSRLISHADIGIDVSVLEDNDGNSSLKLESTATGKANDADLIFSITDDNTSQNSGFVDYLGMNQLSRAASNALFEINGVEKSSPSNTFFAENTYEITLQGPSGESGLTTEIGLKNDVESLSENVYSLTESYNTFIRNISAYSGVSTGSSRLLAELGRIGRHYASNLDTVGLSFTRDGTLQVDDERMRAAASDESARDTFSSVKDFANSMLRKSRQVSLDPMEYVNKTIVSYKNPGRNFAAPYITSAYSGMLFNNYC